MSGEEKAPKTGHDLYLEQINELFLPLEHTVRVYDFPFLDCLQDGTGILAEPMGMFSQFGSPMHLRLLEVSGENGPKEEGATVVLGAWDCQDVPQGFLSIKKTGFNSFAFAKAPQEPSDIGPIWASLFNFAHHEDKSNGLMFTNYLHKHDRDLLLTTALAYLGTQYREIPPELKSRYSPAAYLGKRTSIRLGLPEDKAEMFSPEIVGTGRGVILVGDARTEKYHKIYILDTKMHYDQSLLWEQDYTLTPLR